MSEEHGIDLPRGWFSRIKMAQYLLIKRLGGVKYACLASGVSNGQMGNYYNLDHPAIMPLQVITVLEAEAGLPFVTEAMAEVNGYRVSSPDPGGNDADDATHVADVFRCNNAILGKVGSLVTAVAEALADGKLTPNELAHISRQTAPVRELLSQLDAVTASGRDEGGQVVSFGEAKP